MNGLLTIAHLTFHEARRRKILLAALLLGLAFVGVFALGISFVYEEEVKGNAKLPPPQRTLILNFFTMAGLYAANFLIVMTSALLPVDTVSGEIGSGAIQSLATKPVPRASIVLGKWLGTLAIVLVYATLLVGGVLLSARLITGFTPPGMHIGPPLMLLEGALVMTISIAGGTRLSTLANGVFVFGLFGLAFVGGWVEQIGTFFGNQSARYVGVVASLLMPSESLWQLAAYNMQPPLMRDLNLSPFSPASVPSAAMVLWAVGYVVAVLLFAVRQFGRRNL
jgi:ABC-type transport system involved in multi-copper enzyme maturation permease subunit